MDWYVDGDVGVNNCGYPVEVYSVDEACQRVRFILTTKKGSFIYNRDFGADFSPIFNNEYDSANAGKLAELLCREALAEQKEISVENVELTNPTEGKYHLKMNVLFGGQSKVLEVDLN